MYLSSLILNSRSFRARRDINSFYELHRTIMGAFPDNTQGNPGRVLFRLDLTREMDFPSVLVQSELQPNWSHLIQDHDYLFDVPKSKKVNLKVQTGQLLRFRLRANPTKRIYIKNGSGKRQGLLKAEEQVDWLFAKGQRGGFSLIQTIPINEGFLRTKKNNGRHVINLLSVRFEGVLKIDDPEEFRQTIKSGIGTGKGFGFGLLSIARA